MFKNWSKIVLVSMLVLAMAAPVFATTARVRSLANTGDYMSDDSNVNRWLSTLPSYANQVNAELGFWNQPGAGGPTLSDSRGLQWIFGAGKWGTYRVTINENALDHAGFWMINPFYNNFLSGSAANLAGPGLPGPFASTPVNTWDLAGGWEIGDNMALGVNFTRSRWSYKETDTEDPPADQLEVSNTYTTLGAGFSWTNNEDMVLDLLVNLGFAGGSLEAGVVDPTTNPKLEWDSSNALDIAGRFFWDWKDDITVPVKVEFINAEYSAKPLGGAGIDVPSGDKMNAFQIGAGVNIDVNQNHMLIFAVEFTSMNWEYSNPPTTSGDANAADTLSEISTTVLPTIRLALESSITSWLTTRIGAARHMVKETAKWQTGDEIEATDGIPTFFGTVDAAAFEWFLGVGFNVAEWTIDMELAAETPFSIGYWLTGYSAFVNAEEGPVGRISAVYNY